MSELAELSTVQSRKRLTTKSTASLLVLRESTLTHGPKKATRNNELTSSRLNKSREQQVR